MRSRAFHSSVQGLSTARMGEGVEIYNVCRLVDPSANANIYKFKFL